MIILERDGSLFWCEPTCSDPATAMESVCIPADLVLRQTNIIDRVLDFVFDVLGLHAIEVRIYEERHR